MASKKRVLFVCLGNIVRSPLAENMFRHLAEQKGLGDVFEVDSAGTSAYHAGEHPDYRMVQVAAKNGLEYDGRSRQFTRRDFDAFDLIIAMDMSNRNSMYGLARSREDKEKIHLMREFDPQGHPLDGVPDPYYGGIKGFQETYQIVARSCVGLLDAIQSGRILSDI